MEQYIIAVGFVILTLPMIGIVDYLVFCAENCSNNNTFYGFENQID